MQLVGNCILEMEAGGKAFLRAARVFHEPSLPRCTVSRHFNLSPGLKVLADTFLRQKLNKCPLDTEFVKGLTWPGMVSGSLRDRGRSQIYSSKIHELFPA